MIIACSSLPKVNASPIIRSKPSRLSTPGLTQAASKLANNILDEAIRRGALSDAVTAEDRATWVEVIDGAVARLVGGHSFTWQRLLAAIQQEVEGPKRGEA